MSLSVSRKVLGVLEPIAAEAGASIADVIVLAGNVGSGTGDQVAAGHDCGLCPSPRVAGTPPTRMTDADELFGAWSRLRMGSATGKLQEYAVIAPRQ